MKNILLIFLILFLFSCESEHEYNDHKEAQETIVETEIKSPDTSFSSLIARIPFLELPFTTSCNSCCSGGAEIEYDEWKRYFGDYRPYKRVHSGSNLEIIISTYPADIVLPFIQTFDSTGKLISRQPMLTGYCGCDEGWCSQQHITIFPDLTLTHVDSTWTFEMDSNYNAIEETKKLETKSFNFVIQDNGIIEKVSEEDMIKTSCALDFFELNKKELQDDFFSKLDSILKVQYPNNDKEVSVVDLTPEYLNKFLNDIVRDSLVLNGTYENQYHFNIAPKRYSDPKECKDKIKVVFDSKYCSFRLMVFNTFFVEPNWCTESMVVYVFKIVDNNIVDFWRNEAG